MSPTAAGLIQLLVAVVGGGALVAVINGILMRRKVSAEAESVAVTTANSMLTGLRDEISRLRDRLDTAERKADTAEARADLAEREVSTLKSEMAALRRSLTDHQGRVAQLENEMKKAGLTPPPWTYHPADPTV